ncbi:MAG TPA: hypothetical protein VHE12_11840 [bacterium]|nr:hypothetical protein [bacterium]
MEEITAEQFLQSTQAWKPEGHFLEKVEKQLKAGHAPAEQVPGLAKAFQECSQATYAYIQFIHELATTKVIDRSNFLPQVAQLVGLVHAVQRAGRQYKTVFQAYDEVTRSALTQDQFDTVYYDAIQNIELRELLKKIIEEVEVVLQSFSLVSGDLSGIQCVDLYEACIRFQLFLQYFMVKKSFSNEELWSILFDVYNQVGEMESLSIEPTADELRDLHEKIQKYKNN